jgi:uncharacterized caspase-like protein
VDANPGVSDEYRIQGIPAVEGVPQRLRGRRVSSGAVAADGRRVPRRPVRRPEQLERVTEQLRAEGRWPDVVAAIDERGYERALELLLDRLRRDRDGVRE